MGEAVHIIAVLGEGGEGEGEISVLTDFVCRSHCNKWFCMHLVFKIL